jgi:hypothetical protein
MSAPDTMRAPDQLDELLARKRRLDAAAEQTADFAARLRELRAWQTARLENTYREFRADPRYAPAVEFFLSDLYGPGEFRARDRDLARAWRYLKRALPAPAMAVLGQAIELDVLTLELDHALVRVLAAGPVSDATYGAAYRAADDRAGRTRQIDLIVGIGKDLSRIVRRVWLGPLLHAAHAPAHAAGFGALQDFLERGYATFRIMKDPERLMTAIAERETSFMRRLFDTEEDIAHG